LDKSCTGLNHRHKLESFGAKPPRSALVLRRRGPGDAWPRMAMADKPRTPGKRGWVPASISRIASATGSLVAAAAGSVSRCETVQPTLRRCDGVPPRRPPAAGPWYASGRLFRGLTRAARSYLGYEDLEVVQAGPEGAADDGKPDMFEGQEEVCSLRHGSGQAALAMSPESRHPAPRRAGAQGVVATPARLHGQGHYVAHVRASLHHGETPTSAGPQRTSAQALASPAAEQAACGMIRARSFSSCSGLTVCAAIGRARRSPRRCFKRWLRSWNTASCWTRLRSVRRVLRTPLSARRRRRFAGRRADLGAGRGRSCPGP